MLLEEYMANPNMDPSDLSADMKEFRKRIRFDALQSISNMLTFAWF